MDAQDSQQCVHEILSSASYFSSARHLHARKQGEACSTAGCRCKGQSAPGDDPLVQYLGSIDHFGVLAIQHFADLAGNQGLACSWGAKEQHPLQAWAATSGIT